MEEVLNYKAISGSFTNEPEQGIIGSGIIDFGGFGISLGKIFAKRISNILERLKHSFPKNQFIKYSEKDFIFQL